MRAPASIHGRIWDGRVIDIGHPDALRLDVGAQRSGGAHPTAWLHVSVFIYIRRAPSSIHWRIWDGQVIDIGHPDAQRLDVGAQRSGGSHPAASFF